MQHAHKEIHKRRRNISKIIISVQPYELHSLGHLLNRAGLPALTSFSCLFVASSPSAFPKRLIVSPQHISAAPSRSAFRERIPAPPPVDALADQVPRSKRLPACHPAAPLWITLPYYLPRAPCFRRVSEMPSRNSFLTRLLGSQSERLLQRLPGPASARLTAFGKPSNG